MSVKTNSLSIKWDIWDTEYTVQDYDDHIVVNAPYTKWDHQLNTGNLDFRRIRVDTPKRMALIRSMVKRGELCEMDGGRVLGMAEVLDGYGED